MGGAITGAATGIIVGLICLVIGILNISMLHSYHVNNIPEENKKPFGRLVGLGMIIISITLMVYGALFIPAELLENELYLNIGNGVLIGGLVLGLGISLYAIKKYNKKIIG